MDIGALRREYSEKGIDRSDLNTDPFQQFETWFQQAQKAELLEPNAMVLATVNSEGQAFQRTVLLKSFDRQGFVFFTNYQSRKAQQIAHNSQVSLLFPWYGLERQVHIIGNANKISPGASLQYFITRPRGSQIGAWCSQQSAVVASRQILEQEFSRLQEKFSQGEVPLPPFWGGYRVAPHSFEFWQGRSSRLHDRFLYQCADSQYVDSNVAPIWTIQRLSP
jgi:pyridoxamine 5'-phosphate oxidase